MDSIFEYTKLQTTDQVLEYIHNLHTQIKSKKEKLREFQLASVSIKNFTPKLNSDKDRILQTNLQYYRLVLENLLLKLEVIYRESAVQVSIDPIIPKYAKLVQMELQEYSIIGSDFYKLVEEYKELKQKASILDRDIQRFKQ